MGRVERDCCTCVGMLCMLGVRRERWGRGCRRHLVRGRGRRLVREGLVRRLRSKYRLLSEHGCRTDGLCSTATLRSRLPRGCPVCRNKEEGMRT